MKAFQSTHPARGATSCERLGGGGLGFQSTHPARGATQHPKTRDHCPCFNPRTPRGVRRRTGRRIPTIPQSFNPRTPRGVRQRHYRFSYCMECFNPRTPRGVRLQIEADEASAIQVSIHAPRAGCDRLIRIKSSSQSWFQSTHPARCATSVGFGRRGGGGVSIHAPRAGCDYISVPFCTDLYGFNPRTPRGVRPVGCTGGLLRRGVSIHAPRAGCDCWLTARIPHAVFQSTHPARGATHCAHCFRCRSACFNPRTPRGVRRFLFKSLFASGRQAYLRGSSSAVPVFGSTLSSHFCNTLILRYLYISRTCRGIHVYLGYAKLAIL